MKNFKLHKFCYLAMYIFGMLTEVNSIDKMEQY